MPGKERLEIRLSALEKSATMKVKKPDEQEEDDDENERDRRREVAAKSRVSRW